MTEVRTATLEDVDAVAAIAAAAFQDDPLMCWVFPDAGSRPSRLRVVFAELATNMLPGHGTVHVLDGGCVAMWRGPAFDHSAPRGDRDEPPPPFPADELDRIGVLIQAMRAVHPHEPHWYLNVLGTVPERQGQGLGAITTRPVLEACDADGVPAYLESSNPRNHTFYKRQGFVPVGVIPLPDGPSLTPMWREPRL